MRRGWTWRSCAASATRWWVATWPTAWWPSCARSMPRRPGRSARRSSARPELKSRRSREGRSASSPRRSLADRRTEPRSCGGYTAPPQMSASGFQWRRAGAGILTLCAAAGFLRVLAAARPLGSWLFADLAVIWGWQLVLTLACGSFGWCLVERVLRLDALPTLEKLAHALALGLVAFVVGMYVGGYLGLYGPAFAVGLPLGMLGIGAPAAWPAARAGWAGRRPSDAPSVFASVASFAGALGLGLLYLGLLSPAAVDYDASWNHLVIAQDYARAGRIVPFLADWMKNVPHLGSILNTWAFLVPGLGQPALRWMMALHDEFTVFLWTCVGVSAGVRWISERAGVRGGWASLFLFPGIFVYDGNMGGSADHFLALFAVPLFLAAARWLESFATGTAVLLGVLAGGALLTKIQAVYLLVPIAAASAIRIAHVLLLAWRGRSDTPHPRHVVRSASIVAASAVALSALHFGTNWVFYGNPLYPLAQAIFASHPTIPDAQLLMDYVQTDWHYLPSPVLAERFGEALVRTFTFSFDPKYWLVYRVPTFGSLFTLLLPVLFFLRGARRLWLAAAIGWGALFTWAFTFVVDRNLQAFMPLLASTTGAMIVRGWELGRLARVGLAVLVSLQVVWGADYAFSGSDRIDSAIALIRSGMDGGATNRYASFRRGYVERGRSLPENAVVMLHTHHPMLGIDRPVLLDWAGYQGLIDYRPLRTPDELDRRLREIGVTHVVWLPEGVPAPSKQAGVLGASLRAGAGAGARSFEGLRVVALADVTRLATAPLTVLVSGLSRYSDGLYRVEDLSTLESLPPELAHFARPSVPASGPRAFEGLVPRADAVILGGRARALEAGLEDDFRAVSRFETHAVYVRRTLLGADS